MQLMKSYRGEEYIRTLYAQADSPQPTFLW